MVKTPVSFNTAVDSTACAEVDNPITTEVAINNFFISNP
ncbi:hypothetical protein LTSEMIN_6426 [Salmonella enterica subsp. enterica serovar Minnesota str. A4-603]|nr:hypothetical protein LTSEMIN_6426 [Salmonella enterica subsp. enterica serovar Minnesota str. A4-603]